MLVVPAVVVVVVIEPAATVVPVVLGHKLETWFLAAALGGVAVVDIIDTVVAHSTQVEPGATFA